MTTEQPALEFNAPQDDSVAVYLASGLTALNDDQITIVELVSGLDEISGRSSPSSPTARDWLATLILTAAAAPA